jgi:hypothetical protein
MAHEVRNGEATPQTRPPYIGGGFARRQLLAILSALLGCTLPPRLASATGVPADRAVTVRWRVPREQVPAVRAEMAPDTEILADWAAVEDTKGLPLFYIFVAVVTLPYLADSLLAVYRKARYGGMVIDARGEELTIEFDPRLGGKMILRGDDVRVIEVDEVADPSDLLDALIRARGRS